MEQLNKILIFRYSEDWTKPLPRNERMEEELFNSGHGPSGINFERYEDIPVEMTGTDCPRAIDGFDDVNLTNIVKTNIELAHYAQVMMKKLKRFLVSNKLYPLAHSSSEELNSSNSGR